MERKSKELVSLIENRIEKLRIAKNQLKVTGFNLDPCFPEVLTTPVANQMKPSFETASLKKFVTVSEFCSDFLLKRADSEAEMAKNTKELPFKVKELFNELQARLNRLLNHVSETILSGFGNCFCVSDFLTDFENGMMNDDQFFTERLNQLTESLSKPMKKVVADQKKAFSLFDEVLSGSYGSFKESLASVTKILYCPDNSESILNEKAKGETKKIKFLSGPSNYFGVKTKKICIGGRGLSINPKKPEEMAVLTAEGECLLAQNGKVQHEWHMPGFLHAEYSSIAFSPSGEYLAISSTEKMCIDIRRDKFLGWNESKRQKNLDGEKTKGESIPGSDKPELIENKEVGSDPSSFNFFKVFPSEIWSVCWTSPNEIALGFDDGKISLLNIETNEELLMVDLKCGAVTSMARSSGFHGHSLFWGSWTGQLGCIDLAWRQPKWAKSQHHDHWVTGIASSPSLSVIATCSTDGSIHLSKIHGFGIEKKLWSASYSGENETRFVGVEVAPDNQFVLGYSWNTKTIYFLSFLEGAEISKHSIQIGGPGLGSLQPHWALGTFWVGSEDGSLGCFIVE